MASVTALLTRAQSSSPLLTGSPGKLADGTTLMPNGWRLAPAGIHVGVGDLPLNAVQSFDGKYLIVMNNGLEKPSFSVIDILTWTVKSTMPLEHVWLGLTWNLDGTKLYAAGATQNNVQEFSYADGVLTRARTFNLPTMNGDTFAGGLTLSRDGLMLYVVRVFGMTVSALDLTTGQVTKTVSLPAEPYTCVLSRDGRTLYVSLWGASRIQVFQAPSLTLIDEFQTGEHPNAMAISLDGSRLFVSSGSSSAVWSIDAASGEAIEQISMSLYPNQPPTSTPNSLALSPDGQRLLVANADNNCVAVVDINNSAHALVEGFVPTGWYPTNALFSRDGKLIFILSGKGLLPAANPNNRGMEARLSGTASAVATPDRTALAAYTRTVYTVTPYNDSIRLTPADAPIGSAIPRAVGGSSPIKHVFYVIRENRTYDSVFGDLREGNGAPGMTLFGQDVTPNAHALAQTFVAFDNFYVDADVSADGHAFSTAAYANDFIQKIWQTYYGHRGGIYLSEGGGFMRNPFGNVAAPANGYIWDYARRANVSVRSYGEFVDNLTKSSLNEVTVTATVPGLKGIVSPTFAGFDLAIPDNQRLDVWLQEFGEYVKNGNLPQLSIIRLGNDHTGGAVPGLPTPRAMVAENDLALGRLVEAVSNSVYWKDSAIIAIEDDAQSGADHVDSHRSVLIMASPFSKRAFSDHTFYTTSGVLRTIELILGLPPMSHYDAAATPMYNAFTGTPNLAPYRRLEPRVSTTEKNLPSAFGAAESLSMNFEDADLTPEVPLNEIIWRSVKGKDSPMPPPRRSVFVRQTAASH